MALDQFILDNFYQATSSACITDLTPPTFSGITGLSANSNGSLAASWGAATDSTTPIVYDVYIQASTASGLFASSNRALSVFGLSANIFALADNTLLAEGVTYYVGVRARDAVGNVDANTASLSAVSLGVPASSILSAIAGIWDQVRASHNISGSFGAALQSKVDVDVSTRLAAASYTAPDNTSITAIKAKTDNLPADPASDTTVNTRAPASTALSNAVWTNAKAAFLDVAVSSVAGNVWEQLLASHNTAGTFGANAQNPPLSPSAVASAVWDALTASYTVSGSFGLALQSPSLTPTQIANAVWDALTSAHTVSGSFGLNAQTPSLNPSQVASAVWDALLASYVVSGSFGQKINSLSNGGGGGGSVIEAVVQQTALIEGAIEDHSISADPVAVATIGTEIIDVEIDAGV